MYNAQTPSRAELPSSGQLLRSTLLAAVSAIVILVVIVLPAEYGIDPTGVGRILRMTAMGEIKQQLARQAAADAAAAPAGDPGTSVAAATANKTTGASAAPIVAPSAAVKEQPATWRDEVAFTLTPGEGKEIKLRMKEGERAEFAWAVTGGSVNYDTHGDGGGHAISYEKGRSVPADDGNLVAAFTGNHGWYWRNRGPTDVKLVLRTRGQYSEIKQAQ